MAKKVIRTVISLVFIVSLLFPSSLTAEDHTRKKVNQNEERLDDIINILQEFSFEKPIEKRRKSHPSAAHTDMIEKPHVKTDLVENIFEKAWRMLKELVMFEPLVNFVEQCLERYLPVVDAVTEVFDWIVDEKCHSTLSCPEGTFFAIVTYSR